MDFQIAIQPNWNELNNWNWFEAATMAVEHQITLCFLTNQIDCYKNKLFLSSDRVQRISVNAIWSEWQPKIQTGTIYITRYIFHFSSTVMAKSANHVKHGGFSFVAIFLLIVHFMCKLLKCMPCFRNSWIYFRISLILP